MKTWIEDILALIVGTPTVLVVRQYVAEHSRTAARDKEVASNDAPSLSCSLKKDAEIQHFPIHAGTESIDDFRRLGSSDRSHILVVYHIVSVHILIAYVTRSDRAIGMARDLRLEHSICNIEKIILSKQTDSGETIER